MKILHLISDDKFLDSHIGRWDNSEEQHTFVYLRPDHNYKGKNERRLRKIKPFSPEYYSLIEEAEQYDIIFIYMMNLHKAYLVNRMKRKPIVIWHFYGAEIYNRHPFRQQIVSQSTKGLLAGSKWKKLRKGLIYLNLIKTAFLTRSRLPAAEVDIAIRNTDYFCWYNKAEYQQLRKQIPDLPPFLQLPYATKLVRTNLGSGKKDQVLVGNSRTPANNHIDTLLLLQEAKYTGKVLMPFNYGSDAVYERCLRNALRNISLDITLLEGFVKYEEYVELITQCSAGVFNSYRQMALGNIFIMLINGVKVYLNERNATFEWLVNEGFYVFSVDKCLKSDVMHNDLVLTSGQMEHNRDVFRKFADPAHVDTFLDHLKCLKVQHKNTVSHESIEDSEQR